MSLTQLGRSVAASGLLFAAACARGTAAEEQPSAIAIVDGPVVLHNGLNDVDLLGDRTPGRVLVTWRGNYNGHGYSVVTFTVRTVSDLGDSGTIWQTIPFFGGPRDGETGREIYRTSEGADCTLGDIRVVRHPGRPVDVIIASRALGASFADTASVHFDYYRVARNADAVVGWPPIYLQYVRTVPAHASYCDVNTAFDRELHLGHDGLGHGEGAR